jgi:hypothetical protein
MTDRSVGPSRRSSGADGFIRRIRVCGMTPGPRMKVAVRNGVRMMAARSIGGVPTVTVPDASFPGSRIRPSGSAARIQKQLLGDAKTAAGCWISAG